MFTHVSVFPVPRWCSFYNYLDCFTAPSLYKCNTRCLTSCHINVRCSQESGHVTSVDYGRTCWNESHQCSYQLELCAAEIQRCQMVRTIGLQTTKACNSKTWNIQRIYLFKTCGCHFGVRGKCTSTSLPTSQYVDENVSIGSSKFSTGLIARHSKRNRGFTVGTSKALTQFSKISWLLPTELASRSHNLPATEQISLSSVTLASCVIIVTSLQIYRIPRIEINVCDFIWSVLSPITAVCASRWKRRYTFHIPDFAIHETATGI